MLREVTFSKKVVDKLPWGGGRYCSHVVICLNLPLNSASTAPVASLLNNMSGDQMPTRRNIMMFGSALFAAVALPQTMLSQTAISGGQSSGSSPMLSQAVVLYVIQQAKELYELLQEGSAQSSDVTSTVGAYALLFAHMRETEYTAWLNAKLLSDVDGIRDTPIEPARIVAISGKLSKLGFVVSPDQAERTFDVHYDQRQAFVQQIGTIGLDGIQKIMLTQMQAASKKLKASPVALHTNYIPGSAHMKQVNCAADGIAAGILGLMSPPPLDAAFAAAGLMYEMMAYAGWC